MSTRAVIVLNMDEFDDVEREPSMFVEFLGRQIHKAHSGERSKKDLDYTFGLEYIGIIHSNDKGTFDVHPFHIKRRREE